MNLPSNILLWNDCLVVVGVGLMEIVTYPHLTCGSDALAFVRELRLLLRTLGTCDGNTTGTYLARLNKLDVACINSNMFKIII